MSSSDDDDFSSDNDSVTGTEDHLPSTLIEPASDDDDAADADSVPWAFHAGRAEHVLTPDEFHEITNSDDWSFARAQDMLHTCYALDYSSHAPPETPEIVPTFHLDYVSIRGRPYRPITRRGSVFESVTMIFNKWQTPFSNKHEHVTFDMTHTTFFLGKASTRESYFLVLAPTHVETRALPATAADFRSQAAMVKRSPVRRDHAAEIHRFLIEIFLQTPALATERVQPSWTLATADAAQLTQDKWQILQQTMLDTWDDYFHRLPDPFWRERQPAIWAYDFGANIQLQADPEDVDHHPPTPSPGDPGYGIFTPRTPPASMAPAPRSEPADDRPEEHASPAPASPADDGAHHADPPTLVTLADLEDTLHRKFDFRNLVDFTYALAVELNSCTIHPDGSYDVRCLLADRRAFDAQYETRSGTRGYTFYPLAFSPRYGNITSPLPPRFLDDHVIAPLASHLSAANAGLPILSSDFFQAYSGIKRQMRHVASDLLATQGIASAVVGMPRGELSQQALRVQRKHARLHQQLAPQPAHEHPAANIPYRREKSRLQTAIATQSVPLRFEAIYRLHVHRLRSRHHAHQAQLILEPLRQTMLFYLTKLEVYRPLVRPFPTAQFPGTLVNFCEFFATLQEGLVAQYERDPTHSFARAEAMSLLDRAGRFCFTGDRRVILRRIFTATQTQEGMLHMGWPFIDPHLLNLRLAPLTFGSGWPRNDDESWLLSQYAALTFHYGKETAEYQYTTALCAALGTRMHDGGETALLFTNQLVEHVIVPQLVEYLGRAVQRICQRESRVPAHERRALLKAWAEAPTPLTWTAFAPIHTLVEPHPPTVVRYTVIAKDLYRLARQAAPQAYWFHLGRSTWMRQLQRFLGGVHERTEQAWVPLLAGALQQAHVEILPGEYRGRGSVKHLLRLQGLTSSTRVLTAPLHSLKRKALEAHERITQPPRRTRIDLGTPLPFAQIPDVVRLGLLNPLSQNHDLIAHLTHVRCILQLHLDDELVQLILLIAVTIGKASVMPAVSALGQPITPLTENRNGHVFAASLAVRMLWFLYPAQFTSLPPAQRIPQIIKKLEHQGPNNRLLLALRWVRYARPTRRATPRHDELTLTDRTLLLAQYRELLDTLSQPAHFIRAIFGTGHNWTDHCHAIIVDVDA